MLLQGLRANSALDVRHFQTFDEFQTFDRLGDARHTPLSAFCASARAHFALPRTLLTVQRTFPRILEVGYRTDGIICIIPLTETVNVTVNGIAGAANRVMALRGDIACDIVEPTANLFAILNLDPAISDRGWSVGDDQPRIAAIDNPGSLHRFQTFVERLLNSVSDDPKQAGEDAILRQMEEALLSSLDDVMSAPVAVAPPLQLGRYIRIVKQMDDFLSLHPAADIYSEDLARACGVSQRTLQTATRAVRGTSVHRYLRLKRLWCVRRTLSLGGATTQISNVARANGFWHMGEFVGTYRSVFDETPSDTLARHLRRTRP